MNDILVLGGTGTTGRRIARRLQDAGHGVRTASRTNGDILVDLGEPSTCVLAAGDPCWLTRPAHR